MSKIFWFHYNKPATKKRGKTTISVHFNRKCHLVDNVVVNVPTSGKIRTRQPRFVMYGRCKSLDIKDNIGYIT